VAYPVKLKGRKGAVYDQQKSEKVKPGYIKSFNLDTMPTGSEA
jgi:hypothetical protein